jgi:hypothetical protein
MTIAVEAPAVAGVRTFSLQPDNGLRATFLGLMGRVTAPLRRIDDARLVTATGTVITRWDEGRTIWLLLCSDDYEVGRVALDMARALTIPVELYAVGARVEIRGVAHTHHNLDFPFIGARRLLAA